MDINLGKILLTHNQIQHLSELHSEVVTSFVYEHRTQAVIVTTTRNLSEEEKSQLVMQIQALPDVAISQPTEKDRLLEVLGLTREDISALKAVTAGKA